LSAPQQGTKNLKNEIAYQEACKQIAESTVKPGQVYFHRSVPTVHYRICDVAIDEETLVPVVIYYKIVGEAERIMPSWVRTLKVFTSNVAVGASTQKRFVLVGQ
jgi:hypothetical protein